MDQGALIFISDYVFTEEEILVLKLFPSYLFFLLTIAIGFVLWIKTGFDYNLNLIFALPFAALIISVTLTYGLSFWKRRKLSSLSFDELASRYKTSRSN